MASDGSELERLAPHRDPSYDAQRIGDTVEMLAGYDLEWQEFFTREAIEPVRISYELLSADPPATLRLVLDRLGLDGDVAAAVKPGTKKIADETSRDWVARFRADQAPDGKV